MDNIGERCIQTPLSTICQLYRGGQFYLQRKPKKTSDLSQVTDHRLDQITISSTPLLGGIRTHNFSGDRHRLIARVVVTYIFLNETSACMCSYNIGELVVGRKKQ
jgi:hypothetical protein